MICIYPGCQEKIRCRGLCYRHYRIASRLVKAGRVTWEALEAEGKSVAPRDVPRGRPFGEDSGWFTETKEV